jgi:hypothetical protein
MRNELDGQLCAKFPNLFKDRNVSMQETCMCWGFDHQDGWYQIIHDLSEKLEALILKLPEEERSQCCAAQVKEKWGTLRFYMTASTDEMDVLIREAEKQSAVTCEVCGKPGKLYPGGWYYTACEEHVRTY